jgi:hypothetical protein
MQTTSVSETPPPVPAPAAAGPPRRRTMVAARGVTWFLALFLLFDGGARIAGFGPYVEGTTRYGLPATWGPWIGLTLIACTVLHLVPRTAVLGAVALSAYLGGAVALHLSVQEPFWFPVMVGLGLWWSLWVRDRRVRRLLPLTSADSVTAAR